MIIEIIPCLSDNYSYLIHEKKTNTTSIVDPSEFTACDKIVNKYKKTHTKNIGDYRASKCVVIPIKELFTEGCYKI